VPGLPAQADHPLTAEIAAGLLDTVDFGVAIYRPIDGARDFEFVYLNPAACRIASVDAQDLLGQPLTRALRGASAMGILEALRRVSESGIPEALPSLYYEDDLRAGWYRNDLYALTGGYVAAIFSDTSEQVHLRRAVDEERTRYHLLTSALDEGIWDYDLVAERVYFSPAWKAQLGYRDDELENSFATFEAVLAEDDREAVLGHLARFREHGEGHWEHTFHLRHKDGHYVPILARATPVRDRDGRVIRLLGVHVDLTETRALEDAVARLELSSRLVELEIYEQAVASTQDQLAAVDQDLRYLMVNAAYAEFFGYRPDELIGHRVEELFGGEALSSKVAPGLARCLAGETVSFEEWRQPAVGEARCFKVVYTPLLDKEKALGVLASAHDITALQTAQAQLERIAHHDPLTGLPNRIQLDIILQRSLKQANRDGSQVAVMFIDLDRFKAINDSLGHAAGDEVLRQAASRLLGALRESDSLARVGGDEFVAVLAGVRDPANLSQVVSKLMDAVCRPFDLGGEQAQLSCSIGISLYPDDAGSADELLTNADTAMYEAKEQGRNDWRFYTAAMTAQAAEYLALVENLRATLDGEGLDLVFHPEFDVASGAVVAIEALTRWDDPQLGEVPPEQFIAAAEKAGLVRQLDFQSLDKACAYLAGWQADGIAPPRLGMNVSPKNPEPRRHAGADRGAAAPPRPGSLAAGTRGPRAGPDPGPGAHDEEHGGARVHGRGPGRGRLRLRFPGPALPAGAARAHPEDRRQLSQGRQRPGRPAHGTRDDRPQPGARPGRGAVGRGERGAGEFPAGRARRARPGLLPGPPAAGG